MVRIKFKVWFGPYIKYVTIPIDNDPNDLDQINNRIWEILRVDCQDQFLNNVMIFKKMKIL
jgi:hypothetical protein